MRPGLKTVLKHQYFARRVVRQRLVVKKVRRSEVGVAIPRSKGPLFVTKLFIPHLFFSTFKEAQRTAESLEATENWVYCYYQRN